MSVPGRSWGRAAVLAAVLWLTATAGAAAKDAVSYLWPFDRTPELTSSFGEYRSGRFHMGIDLSTNGATGIPVRAAADGHVSQVRCSPWGYGKAVYVAFDDGYTAVYGHLSGFRDDLRDYVRREQHKRESYTVDMTPGADQFPVKRGEEIAFSGDTGIGPAHLHFELRDKAGRPVSPRLLGMTWPDAEPPVFKAVLVVPRDPVSRVEGDVMAVVRKAEHIPLNPPSKGDLKEAEHSPQDSPSKGGLKEAEHSPQKSASKGGSDKKASWSCAPVHVQGEFAVAVDLVDPTPTGSKLGIHEAKLIAPDGSTVFEVRHDTIAYDEHGVAFAYHPAFNGEGHFLLLWRWPGNAAASDAVSPGDGWCAAPGEEVRYRIELVDFMGNAATLELPIKPGGDKKVSAESKPAKAVSDKADGELKLDAPGTFLVVTATFPTPETRAPELTIDGSPVLDAPFFPVDKRRFRAAWQPATPGRRVMICATHPRLAAVPMAVETLASGAARAIPWEDGPKLNIPAGAACGPLFLRAEALASAPAASVFARGTAWRLWPDTAPLAAAAEITLPLPDSVENPAHAAIARRSGDGWSWLKTARQGGLLTARTEHLGDFRVIEDDRPPRELEFTPGGKTPVTSLRPRIHASVLDAGSGIAAWKLLCDGHWLLSAYDPEAGCIDWERDEDLAPGAHEITLTLTDGAGNSSTMKHGVVVPKK